MTNLLVVTAYCACKLCCGYPAKGITASGVKPVEGITIAMARTIPFGTKIYIEGVGPRIVQDRLALRFDNRVDVYFKKHKDAKRFGKQTLKVIYETKLH